MRTEPGFAAGSHMCSILRTSGPSGSRITAAFIIPGMGGLVVAFQAVLPSHMEYAGEQGSTPLGRGEGIDLSVPAPL